MLYLLVMGTEMRAGIGASWRPDGDVVYRTGSSGELVGVLPARCRRGAHDLHREGYKATETGGVLRVSCTACSAQNRPDHAWSLQTRGCRPARAELDDTPYTETRTQLQQRS